MKPKIKTDTIVRTIVLILALLNQILAIKGKEVLPVTEDEVYQLLGKGERIRSEVLDEVGIRADIANNGEETVEICAVIVYA